jgi:hypothetical protein
MKEWDLNPGFLFVREAIPPSHQKLNQKQKAEIKTGLKLGFCRGRSF